MQILKAIAGHNLDNGEGPVVMDNERIQDIVGERAVYVTKVPLA